MPGNNYVLVRAAQFDKLGNNSMKSISSAPVFRPDFLLEYAPALAELGSPACGCLTQRLCGWGSWLRGRI